MNAVERALRDFLAVRPKEVRTAIVGGVAVGVRTEPRFTRDLDFAVAVASDAEAEQCVFSLRQVGYEISAALEQVQQTRLSTIRLRRRGKGPLVDLLFAATGIENEIVAAGGAGRDRERAGDRGRVHRPPDRDEAGRARRQAAAAGSEEITPEIARAAGELRARRTRAGRPVTQADMLIAATALVRGWTLATRNVPDFEDCGVLLFNPFAS